MTVAGLTLAVVVVAILLTVRVNACVLGFPTEFEAFRHTVYVPADPAGGVPDKRPVDDKLMPEGKVDAVHEFEPEPVQEESVNEGAGYPVAVTWKLPALPIVKVVFLPLVIDGA